MKSKKCSKCNNDILLLMEFKGVVETYYCPHCYATIEIIKETDEEFAWCDPSITIEDMLYIIASSIPESVFEEKNISKDTFLKILLDKKKKESFKNSIK